MCAISGQTEIGGVPSAEALGKWLAPLVEEAELLCLLLHASMLKGMQFSDVKSLSDSEVANSLAASRK